MGYNSIFLPIFCLRPKDQEQYHQVLLVHLASSSSKYTEVHELHPHPISPAHCFHSSTVLTVCCGKPHPNSSRFKTKGRFEDRLSRYVKHETKKTNGKLLSYNSFRKQTKGRLCHLFLELGSSSQRRFPGKIPFSDPLEICQGASLEKSPQQPKVPEQLSQQPHLSWKFVGSCVCIALDSCFFFGKEETKQIPRLLQTKFKTRSVAKYIQGCISGNQIGHYILVQSHCSSSADVTLSWVWHDGSRSRCSKGIPCFCCFFLHLFSSLSMFHRTIYRL